MTEAPLNGPAGAPSTSQASLRHVASATGLISAMVLLSRLLGFLRDAILAAYFGQGWHADAYRYGFKIPDVLWMLVMGGVMYAAYIPVVSAYFARDDEDAAWETYSIISTLLFCVLGVIIPVCWVFADKLLAHVLAPGLAPETLVLATKLTRIVLPAQFFFFQGSLMMGMQQARKQFLIPALGPVIYNVGSIAGGLLLSHRVGIASFAWGALTGALVGNLLLQTVGMRGIGARYRPSLDLRHEGVRKCGRLALPVVCGLSLPQVDSTINGIVIASVQGGMAILENTNRLMQLPLGIIGQAMGIAILPTLSQQAAQEDLERFREMVSFGVRMVLYLTLPLATLLAVLAQPIIAVVFERGAFSHLDTIHAVPALRLYAIGIGAYAAQAIVARAFYARQNTWTPVLSGTFVTLAVFVPLNFALFHLLNDPARPWLATRGPALATALGATCNFTLLFCLLHRQIGGIGLRRILVSLLQVITGCLVLALVAAAAARAVQLGLALGRQGALLEVLVGGGGGLAVYAAVTAALANEEARQVLGMFREKLSRRR